ncbi:resolvase-like protein [Pseudonocardia sediminis]|uniref:Resolvase-like protein n=1 Tax=Pseudonocardia sediminis TaxID=1397368 RepID=A0A4Q7V1B9_PSEST|nr:recombinase family protein [Pseudonocardia sediminis]RZT87111.1 resolvase-like protein [Pseudonocardia sediminis]
MGNPARRVAIYVRISRDRTGANVGVERQERECREVAERTGWSEIVEVYVDNDLSAYSGKPRPAYRRMVADVAADRIDTVLCWHTDRLHRSPIELEEWISVCEPRNVDVHTVKAGPIDLATPAGRMVARQLGAVARYESEHRSERVTAGMLEVAQKGWFRGGARPFGFEADGMTIRTSEASLIKSGSRAILDGKSLRSVVMAWNKAGAVTAVAGQLWSIKTTSDVLTRARNAGLIERRGVVIGPAAWPAIVNETEWRGVVAILRDPGRRTNYSSTKARWLGSNLYRCGVCGGRLTVSTAGSAGGKSYRCKDAASAAGGRHVSRDAPQLDQFVEEVLITKLSLPDAIEVFQPEKPVINAQEITDKLATISAERDELGKKLGRGEITLTMLNAANDGYAKRERELQDALTKAATINPVHEIIGAQDVRSHWEGLDLHRRRAILETVLIVTVMPAPRGQLRGGTYFDPDSIRIEPAPA